MAWIVPVARYNVISGGQSIENRKNCYSPMIGQLRKYKTCRAKAAHRKNLIYLHVRNSAWRIDLWKYMYGA